MTNRRALPAALRWGLVVAYLGLTFYLSSRPQVPGASLLPDYVLHFAEFSILALLLLQAFSGGVAGPHGAAALAGTLVLGTVYGAVDEIHQAFVLGRDSSLKDWFVDVLATGAVVLGAAVWSRRARTETS